MKARLPNQMQSYVAESCIGASALRGQGAGGLIEASRQFFKNLDLSTIPTKQRDFDKWLNKKTSRLLETFPQRARHFGPARKALNLFLRSAAYNVVLNRVYHLDSLLRVLELPLDSYAARHLHCKQVPPDLLPKWNGLKWVTKAEHREFQAAAQELSTSMERGVHRVDLDAFFFREQTGAT